MTRERLEPARMARGTPSGTLALRDGSRIDDGQLVSAGRSTAPHLWLFVNGRDTFVPRDDVIDLWEIIPA